MTPPSTETTVCPLCAVGCSLAYDPETGQATGRHGAVNTDRRLCSKGLRAFDYLEEDQRITRPYLRRDGDLEPASWDEVYRNITSAFTQIITRAGPDGLAFLGSAQCTIEENYLFQKVARILGTNNIDNRARVCHAGIGAVMRDRLGSDAMTNTLTDLQQAEAYLVIGANPAEAQPIAFDTYIRPTVADGATLIVIDPRRTATARIADWHVRPQPGWDADLLTAMAAVVTSDGLEDMGFIGTRTTGYDRFVTHLDHIDPTEIAHRAGVKPENLRLAAKAFATASTGAALIGTGLEPSGHSRSPAGDAVLNLLLLTGNLGQPGTGMNLLRGRNNEQGAIDAGCRPFTLPGGLPVEDHSARTRLGEIWGVEPPSEPGLSEPDILRAMNEDIYGIWVFGENPAVSTLDIDVRNRLAELEYLVVQDAVWTETVEQADAILPASRWAEKSGTVTNLDRQVQRLQSLGEPPGMARHDIQIISELGTRLTGHSVADPDIETVFAEFCRTAPPYSGLATAGTSTCIGRWPYPSGAQAGIEILHQARFENGRRRAPFLAVPVADQSEDARGLVLLTGAIRAAFQGREPDAPHRVIQIHPRDANQRGITDGDTIEIATDNASVTATATITTAVRPGTVFAPAGSMESIAQGSRQRISVTKK